MLLVLDNRDSFTFNLVQVLHGLGVDVVVRRADALDLAGVRRLAPDRILIGPGPGRPEDAETSLAVLRELGPEGTPMLGICLGHQALSVAWGGRVERARELVHGWTVPVHHDGIGVFEGLPDPLAMTRYNSLAVVEEGLPDCLTVSARDPGGEILGLRHRALRIEGVQFHPESILSEHGVELLANFARPRVAR